MMNLLSLLPANNIALQSSAAYDFLTEIAVNAITGLFAIAGITIAAMFAYRYALKRKRKEIFIGLKQKKYERKLIALEACWKLLAFTTDTENSKSVITWKLLKDNSKVYYLNKKNAETFIKKLAKYFYSSGMGIYLSKEIKKNLFEYRSIVYGFLLKEKNNEEMIIRIKKQEVAKKMIEIHQQLILQLKNEADLIEIEK